MTRSRVRDLVRLNVVMAALTLASGFAQLGTGDVPGNRLRTAVTVVVLAGAVLAMNRLPWTAFLAGYTAALVSGHVGVVQDNFIAEVVSCLTLTVAIAYRRPVRESLLALVYGYTALMLSAPAPPGHPRPANLAWMAILTGGAWSAGRALRARRELIEELRETTEQLRHSRAELVDRAVDEERLRIAQDLHDVVAHSVTVMLVQATAADRAITRDPAGAKEAMGAVQETARQTLGELRQMLGVLRSASPAAASLPAARTTLPAPATAPQPGLAEIPGLLAHFVQAGLRVDYDPPGPVEVTPSIALTAYRVVQESLTNVLKHSAAQSVRVQVHRNFRGLLVDVADPGPRRTAPANDDAQGGLGLQGMRERVRACGGDLTAVAESGGFHVRACLPVDFR
ncbi:MAG: histidine kinase [Dermatophilaceae bacterium]